MAQPNDVNSPPSTPPHREIVRNCLVCGKKLSKHRPYQRYYCGHKCLGVAQRNPPDNRTCVVCGNPLKRGAAKYCSQKCHGEPRKKVVHGNCKHCGKPIQRLNRGHLKDFCDQSCVGSYYAEKNTDKWVAGMESRVKLSIEGILASPLTGNYETNKAAKTFSLLSPNGRVYEGKNIRHFVRNHEHLFEACDVNWKPYKAGHMATWCRASNGLTRLKPTNRKPLLVWKGWMWYGPETTIVHLKTDGGINIP